MASRESTGMGARWLRRLCVDSDGHARCATPSEASPVDALGSKSRWWIGMRKAHDPCRERLLATNCQSAHQWRVAQILRAPMTVPARDVMLRIERPIERPEAADEEESPCPPPERELLLSMFRVLKDLHLYCEESGRGELVAEVVDALSMCTADFTALASKS